MTTFTLDVQIACARRELALRERTYPRWIEKNRMSKLKADHEIAAMRAILDTLTKLQEKERLL